MDRKQYFESITLELNALKNRVYNFIGDRHWQTVGEWRESVLRAVLRRNLPQSISIGKGFVITESGPSTQIDILLYDADKPVLYQDGDLALVTADSVRGIIEVKTRLQPAELGEAAQKLGTVAELARRGAVGREVFCGMFVYEPSALSAETTAEMLRNASQRSEDRIINCISIGDSQFVRYWAWVPEDRFNKASVWRPYDLPAIAPAYFLHNTLECLCSDSVQANNLLWFPVSGKEPFRTGRDARFYDVAAEARE